MDTKNYFFDIILMMKRVHRRHQTKNKNKMAAFDGCAMGKRRPTIGNRNVN